MSRKDVIKTALNFYLCDIVIKYDFYLQGQLNLVLNGMVPFNCILELPDGRIVGAGRMIKIWDLKNKTEKIITIPKRHKIDSLNYFKGKLITHSFLDPIKVWDLEEGKCLQTLYFNGSRITCFTFREDKIIIGFDNSNIKIYDFETQFLINELKGHTNRIRYLKIFKGRLISSCSNCQLRIWDNEVLLFNERGENLICFLDGDRLAYKYDNNQRSKVIDLNGNLLHQISCCLKITNIEYYDGKLITSDYRTITIWNNFIQEKQTSYASAVFFACLMIK